MKKFIIAVLITLALYSVYSFSYLIPFKEKAFVERVIDGDTIDTSVGRIRMLGINAPDKKEPYYEESTERLEHLLEGQYVEIEKGYRNKDNYGRLLRYVYLDGELVNVLLIREGYAVNFGYNTKYNDKFAEAEDHARKNNLGMWSFN